MAHTTRDSASSAVEAAAGRRADARRSIEAIVQAALAEITRTGEVNTTEIARAAGVGRVTLYGHFPTREDLVEAVVKHSVSAAHQVIATVDLGHGSARQRLHELTLTSWRILNDHRQLMAVGLRYLGATRMRKLHDVALTEVERLIARGQRTGEFRTDAPVGWLVTTCYALLHAAADEVNNGRLSGKAAGPLVAATLTSALSSDGTKPGESPQ
jgi:AcrR family transcriptional regulator